MVLPADQRREAADRRAGRASRRVACRRHRSAVLTRTGTAQGNDQTLSQHGWALEEGEDDLDSFVGAAFQLGLSLHADFDGRTRFALMPYKGHPPATATIYLPFQVQDEKAIAKAAGHILKELHLSQRLLWQRRHVRAERVD